jgi:hypothetical protein
MSKVDLFAPIRRESGGGMSARPIARKYRVGRRTAGSIAAAGIDGQLGEAKVGCTYR